MTKRQDNNARESTDAGGRAQEQLSADRQRQMTTRRSGPSNEIVNVTTTTREPL